MKNIFKIQFWTHENNQNTIPHNLEMENEIQEWLKDNNADCTMEFKLYDKDDNFIKIMLWSKAEIYIKACSNVWEVWRIAKSNLYNKLISYKVKEIGTNEMINEEFKLPNEIKTTHYNKDKIWNII